METKKTILVVEDEKTLREAVVDILRLKNFNPIEAKNGKEGVEVALKEHPDLILLDLVMPEMDGMTAFKKIRKDAWGAHVPVIILTNLSDANQHLVDDVLTHKPMNYLIKSDWKLLDVVKKVEEVLDMK
jgi:DNA-binding response OmpR family regulator